MALPPCHMFCQFYVHQPKLRELGEKSGLSCIMYQRSADLGLGIPFNIASYALLTHIMSQVTGTEPRELIMQLGDAHVYKDHVEALKKQLEREPKPFPRLQWLRSVDAIDDLQAGDFTLEDYNAWPSIPMKMSV
jgi:thymidylate synthase